jgi:hypothetical protein
MTLTWRDAAATGVVAVAGAVYWAFQSGAGLPLLSGPRVVAMVVFGLGVGACVLGGSIAGEDATQQRWVKVYGLHGALAFGLALAVVVTGNRTLLAVLVGLVALLWLVATGRHAAGAVLHRVHRTRELTGTG